MKKIFLVVFFLLALIANLVAIYLDNETLRMISKPLLMPILAIFLLTGTSSFRSNLKPWLVLALFFSWVGDILLMFESRSANFFLFGLSAFLLAQACYLIFFHGIRMREYIRGNALLLLVVVLYYAIFISILTPYLGNMKLPVSIYGVVLSFMLMLAMHTMLGKNKKAGWWMMFGAILFVTSDSLLAFNKFYMAFHYAGVAVMLTYGLAQLFIINGAIQYLVSEKDE